MITRSDATGRSVCYQKSLVRGHREIRRLEVLASRGLLRKILADHSNRELDDQPFLQQTDESDNSLLEQVLPDN